MTNAQQNAVNRIKAELVTRDSQEFKQFDVKPTELTPDYLVVETVVGEKNDEGSALKGCRVTRLFFVGPRGGIELHFFSNSSCVKSGTPLAQGNAALHYYEVK